MSRQRLPAGVRRLVAACAISAFGTGLVLPLTLIYLHRVRDIPLSTTGLLLAIPGLIGLVAVPVAGMLMDRIGARLVLATSMLLLAAAQLALAFTRTAPWAAPVLLLQGIALSPTFPAFSTMFASMTSGELQQRVFAINFTALNAAIGVGGLVGGAVVDVQRPGTFQAMFIGNSVVTALAALLALSIDAPAPAHAAVDGEPKAGYRQVLGDRRLRRIMVLTLLLALTGYAALDSGLPAYANVVADVPARVIAWSLSANTLVIVVAQLFVLRLLRGRRRTRALAIVGVIWCASWLLLGSSALPSSEAARITLVVIFAALFGFGETFMAPSIGPLVNSLAAPQVRGRANALSSGTYSVAFVISPAISAGFIAAGLGGVWIALLAVGCLTVSAVALRLSRGLTLEEDLPAAELPLEPGQELLAAGAE
jgi:MFS family permease